MSKQQYTVKGLLGHEIGITSGVLRRVFAARIRTQADNISPEQFAVLVRLSSGEGLTQNEIADYVLKDDATITRVLDSLEKKGLALRKKSDHDRRANLAFITSRGKALVEKVFPMLEKIHEKLREGIGEGELATAIRVLERLRNNAMQL
ncbi:MarR family transcriptional regulator [Prosthecochloris sp. GSB1]|uniref:MarR family winged helix-turn-helix transcriptional regulator n=1 Tax=Prosthecochloris sp. GSB1 TaxID=281093 RepID=UPI000B8CF10A|nr:MarR family transcriptional regulator [Prosthecochloris sp. GSB1]ASQ90750.1 MarR family transcriptional regulator [Prosthecochloris sp. GSB1]